VVRDISQAENKLAARLEGGEMVIQRFDAL
jgi:hypothetical protein